MKYLKRYEKFLYEVKKNSYKNIDNELMLIERKILDDFATDFWDLSLNSIIFTNEEKKFIKKNLMNYDMIKEGWFGDTINNVWNNAKKTGGKIWDSIKNKVSIIKENIKNLVKDISNFLKSILSSFNNTIINKSNELLNKLKTEFPSKIKEMKIDPKNIGGEINQLNETYKFIKNKLSEGLFVDKINSEAASIEKNAQEEVNSLQDLKNESFDILSSFYLIKEADEYNVGDTVKYKRKNGDIEEKEIEKIEGDKIYFKSKDGSEFYKLKTDIINNSDSNENSEDEKDEKKGVWQGFAKWFLDMEESNPPKDGKASWWIKLILKIISLFLSPIVKSLEVAVKLFTSNLLKGVSSVVKFLNGPGVYEFVILSGILAGIPALATEISLVGHKMPEEWAHIFEIVSHFLTEVSGFKILLTIFGGFCTTMTLYQLVTEFKHLFSHHGHDDHSTEPSVGD